MPPKIRKRRKEGMVSMKPAINPHKGMTVSSCDTGMFMALCPHKIKTMKGITIRAAGCGDLKKRIIGVKSREF